MDIKRLKWATRRGMLELDLILLPFLENRYSELEESDQARFRKLLACQDPELFSWFMGKSVPEDAEMQKIVEMVNLFSQASPG